MRSFLVILCVAIFSASILILSDQHLHADQSITVSSIGLDSTSIVEFKNNIDKAARPPAKNAPIEKGTPTMKAPTTPGTIEWLKASPIKDQPLSIKYEDKKAHSPPTKLLINIAFTI